MNAAGTGSLRALAQTGVARLGAPYYVQNLAAGAMLVLVVVVQLLASQHRRRGARLRLAMRPG